MRPRGPDRPTTPACCPGGRCEIGLLYPGDGGDRGPEDLTVTKTRVRKADVFCCRTCGLVFSPAPQDIRELYARTRDEKYERQRTTRLQEFQLALRSVLPFLPSGMSPLEALDAGCQTGIAMEALHKLPGTMVRARGVEPSRWAVETARSKGLDVEQGFFEDFSLPQQFDLVTMFDVLEHAVSPEEFLNKARQVLRPRGLVLITTPNIDSLFHKVLGRRYWFIEAMHLTYFSPRTLGSLLKKTGFEVLSVRKHYKMLEWGYAWERLFGIFPGVVPRALSHQKGTVKLSAGQMLIVARKT